MNQAHYHLILNHLPIIFPIVGLMVLIISLVFKSEAIKSTSYFIFIVGAIFTIPAFSTGEGAEEVVENLPGIQESLIKAHEELAEIFAILSYLLGGLSLIGFYFSQKKSKYSNYLSLIVLVFSIIVLFYAKQTGTTGGEIRHSEIRSGVSQGAENAKDDSEEEED